MTLSASDALTPAGQLQMQVSNDASFSGAVWQACTPSLAWTLPAALGPHTVYVRFRDAAGNISATVTDTIDLKVPLYIPVVKK